MPTVDELFPAFTGQTIPCVSGDMFARVGGSGPPLLLLHGFPQTHVMWHPIANALAKRFMVVAMDLPGYGWSVVPKQKGKAGWDKPAPEQGASMTKRAMAKDAVRLMEKLGHATFACVGHDRGGRVGYRMALDNPGVVTKLAVLDIVTTLDMWAGMNSARAIKAYHWGFLAQPYPLPETLIGNNARYFLEHTLSSWTASGTLEAFHPTALKAYHEGFEDPLRIHAMCEDYRAGAGFDRAADAEDLAAGRKINAPLLALWGAKGFPSEGADPLTLWQRFADHVSGAGINSGHFLVEENPAETLARLEAFL